MCWFSLRMKVLLVENNQPANVSLRYVHVIGVGAVWPDEDLDARVQLHTAHLLVCQGKGKDET